MTIAADPGRRDGRVLVDAHGRELARFQEAQRDGRRVADLFALSVPAGEALAPVLAQLAGWRVSQLFRHPDAPGLGHALLRRALALTTRDGVPALGLAVTEGNAARRLYEAHGFAVVLSSITVGLREAGVDSAT